MPFAIPMIATFAAAGGTFAGVAALAASGVAGFMTVAGAALTLVGGVTGEKGLMKLGGLMSLGGGIAGGFSGGTGAEGNVAQETFRAGELARNEAVTNVANETIANNAANAGAQTAGELGTATLSTGATNVSPAVAYGQAGNPGLGTTALNTATQEVGTKGALDWLNKVGGVVKQNKELFQLGGQMLQSVFGPEAEALDMKRQELERRRRNMNSVVPLGMLGRGN